jgi:putative DNA primase/helicase
VNTEVEQVAEPIPLTDTGNCERFAQQHGDCVKHVHLWGKWFLFNGRYWQHDTSGEVVRRAKQTARSIYAEAAMFTDRKEQKEVSRWAHASQSHHRIQAMLALAKSEQPIPLDHDTLDSDGWLLNSENGTVDLKTGKLQKHRAADFQSMTTGVEFPTTDVPTPLWSKFLDDTFEGNAALIGFVQRLCGLALVGHVYEHILPIAIGTGSNGKTVFTETIRSVLGDYAMVATQGLLLVKKHQTHSTEVADLFRKRLVIVSETNDGSRLDEGLVKTLTGGEAIRARRMREDNWQFVPSHTLLLVTNHRPVVKGTDCGIWRRIRLVPFNAHIAPEKQDPALVEKLKPEYPGILRWMVQGCLAWQRGGLQEPPEVLGATGEYRAQQDVLGQFVDDCCIVGGSYQIQASPLYKAYRQWAETSGEHPENRRNFSARMVERGFEKKKNNQVWYVGLTLSEG